MTDGLKYLEDDFLSVSDMHKVHFMTFGNKHGIPLINFHGGPGSATTEKIAASIDQDKYYIILFDQRGCGQSVPSGELRDNTTNDLIYDANKILKHLNIDKVVVSGGSWGSALAIKYAETFPDNVLGLFVYSVCLFRKEDIQWYIKTAGMLFPSELNRLYDCINTNNYKNFSQEYEKSTIKRKQIIATDFFNYATTLGKGLMEPHYIAPVDLTDTDLSSMSIFLHYLSNDYFLGEDDIFHKLKQIQNIPAVIVHGKLDFSCPLNGAYTLANTLSNVDLCVLETAGHFSPEVRNEFFKKINKFKL